MKKIFSFLTKKYFYYAIARYALSIGMLGFGVMKILGLQFNNIAGPASSYQQSLEHLTGIQLTWAFLGYSTWFQVLLGILEFVPASLLLFRRTAFAGAIFLLPMTICVFFINFGLHLWQDTQILSAVHLVLNLSLFLFEWKKVRQMASIAFGAEGSYKYILTEIIVAIILISGAVVRKGQADYGKSRQDVLTGDWYHRHPVEYSLIAEKINDSTIPPHVLKSFFGSWEEYSEINDIANNWDGYKSYSVNEKTQTLTISDERNRISKLRGPGYYYLSGSFRFELPGDTLLLLHQKVNDTTKHTWVFRKRIMNPNGDF